MEDYISNMEEQSSIVTVTPTPIRILVREVSVEVSDPVSGLSDDYDDEGYNLSKSSETSHDELMAMLQVESNHYGPPENYLALESCKSGVNENWRRRMCEWMFEVTDHYDFDREVVSFAFDYLDRSIPLAYGPTSNKKLSKREYQLYAVTSLYLAIKVHGEMDPNVHGERLKLRITNFQELSRGLFETETIEATEREMLSLFQWRVNPPTCAQYLSSFLRLLPERELMECESPREDVICRIFDVAKYLTELSIFVSDFSFKYNPSMIAYSAILCAIEYIEESTKRLPFHIQVRFLLNIKNVSNTLTPDSVDIRHIQTMLKKLAPKMFTQSIRPLPRTVSFLEDDTANTSVAAASRSISHIVMLGTDEPKSKRRKV